MSNQHTNIGQDAEIIKRLELIVSLREGGISFRQIAKELEKYQIFVSHVIVYKTWKKAYIQREKATIETVTELIKLDIDALNKLQASHWQHANGFNEILKDPDTDQPILKKDGTPKVIRHAPSVRSTNMVIKIMKRRAELLGLDESKLDYVVDPATLTDDELGRLRKKVKSARTG